MSFDGEISIAAEFLRTWPIERLRTMTLAEYTTAGDKNSFTYWIEARLSTQGSIWGGSAFKFGIFSRRQTTEEAAKEGRMYDDKYGWYSKFGATSEAAFAVVRQHVVAIAEAARDGRLEAIDEIPLGDAVKWKIAYHYQSETDPKIVCIFTKRVLLSAAGRDEGDRKAKISGLQRAISVNSRSGESILDKSSRIWRDFALTSPYELRLTDYMLRTGLLTMNVSAAPFSDDMHGGASEDERGASAQFVLDTGEMFACDIKVSEAGSGTIRHDFSGYFDAIKAKRGDSLIIAPKGELSFAIHRKGQEPPVVNPVKPGPILPPIATCAVALNQILFGPPGTGKTYHTIDLAVKLLDAGFFQTHADNRAALKQRYDELTAEGLIRFVTFHQSFSYEDFVEGLRAETDDETGQLKYEIADGVFKQLCEAARTTVVKEAQTILDLANRRIWKLSLGNSYTEQHIFDECIANGYALVGFGAGADYAGVKSRQDIESRYEAAGGKLGPNEYAPTALNLFILQMKVGDLVVITDGNLKFRAIGEITGDYRLLRRDGSDTYVQSRAVRWLRVYTPSLPATQLMENRFSQMTLYELREGSINSSKLRKLLEPTQSASRSERARILIIDEINRGNVSRVFGELITLIEPSKREGAPEALTVTLPYSKKEFSVPANLHIIGTMNTADRSLAGMDIALRRRFDFVEMAPRSELLRNRIVGGADLGDVLETMNQRIEVLLDRDHQVGHSYFMSIHHGDPLAKLATVFRNQIIPLLQEYFFEDWQRIAWVLNDHRKLPQHQFLQQPSANVVELFGTEGGVPTEAKRWHINEAAFQNSMSYTGIVKVESVTA